MRTAVSDRFFPSATRRAPRAHAQRQTTVGKSSSPSSFLRENGAQMSRPYGRRTVRLFVKNIPRMTPQAELRRHFEGVSAEPDDVLNVFMREFSATVRMRNEEAAERARRALHGTLFRHLPLYVYRFRGIKIYVGNLPKGCGTEDIRPLFEDFGPVVACDVVKSGVKDYAFVHMDNEEDGRAAIKHLNGMELKGSYIAVQRSVKDHMLNARKQNSEQHPRVEGNTFPDPYYEDQPHAAFDQDYRPQSTTGQGAAYRNGAESEPYNYPEASRGRTHSAHSHSYGGKSYDSHNSVYGNQADSYSKEFSDSLSTRNRASADVAYQSAPDRFGSGYRAQSPRSRMPRSPQRAALSGWRLETTSRYSLYERVRLSPPSSSYEDLYRDEPEVNKRHMTKHMEDSYSPPYEHVCLSPPHSSRNDFNRRGNGPSGKYTARSEGSPRHRPYERIRLSPPRRSRENHRSFR
nr:PREDICTED: RNA-binding protein 4.1 [Anolis carolinensis]|eukprot:XP_003229564.2 PREDICTED: RNA-binding protein 4.1 [Anolis carolinensis]